MPILPPELEFSIVQFATKGKRPGDFVHLLLVARRFQEWTEPLIYRTIQMTNASERWMRSYPPILSEIDGCQLTPPLLRNAHHTRHILLQNVIPSTVQLILKACTQCTHLTLWIDSNKQDGILDTIRTQNHSLLHLSCNPTALHDPEGGRSLFYYPTCPAALRFRFDHTPFLSLTHLNVTHIYDGQTFDPHYTALGHLPKLIHFAASGEYHEQFILDILGACRSLKLFVVCSEWYVHQIVAALLGRDYPMVVVVLRPRPVFKRLEQTTRGGHVNIWDRGDAIVAARSLGQEDPVYNSDTVDPEDSEDYVSSDGDKFTDFSTVS